MKVFVTRRLPAVVESRLDALFDVTFNRADTPLAPEELCRLAAQADVLVPALGDTLDRTFFENAAPRLKLVANFGAGVDHIDIGAASAGGVTVTNTPSVLTDDAADMAMALILAVPRRLAEGMRALEDGSYRGWSPTWMMGRRVRGKTLGIIGLGRVGEAVARRAGAFGLSIHYHNRNRINPHVEKELGATYRENLDDMMASVDIVSVNCPHTPSTFHLCSRRRLELMRADSYIVNISRGGVVDESALADLIARGRIAGAGLDVYERGTPDRKLLDMPNVVLLPHMASSTVESRTEMGERVIINIRMFADGHRPPDRVIPGLEG